MLTIPKEMRENIARAKGYLRRDALTRAMETFSLALRESTHTQLLKPARFELEVHFEEFLRELNAHAGMLPLLDPHSTGKPRTIPYQKGKEGTLAAVLESLSKMLNEAAAKQEQAHKAQEEQRKYELMDTGVERIKAGELAKGRAFLKRAAAEYGHQEGVYMEVGKRLAATAQYNDAAETFEKAMEQTPKDAEAYAQAIAAYTASLEYAKAEAVYIKILKQCGSHPRTFGKMAQLYMLWHKRIKADDFAHRALHMDPEQPEALEVVAALDKRGGI